MVRPACSRPPSHQCLILVLTAVLTTGRRTVATWRRTAPEKAPGQMSSSPRVLSQRRGSAWVLARAVITYLLAPGIPSGPGRLAGNADGHGTSWPSRGWSGPAA
jgi:hypothetical protein